MPLFTRWQEILKEPEKRAEKDWSELENRLWEVAIWLPLPATKTSGH